MPIIGKPGSQFWFGSDLETGVHYLEYRPSEFDALEHLHGEFNITLCMDRSFSINRCGQMEHLSAGDMIVINPGDPHFSRYGVEGAPTKGLTFFVPKRTMYGLLARMYPNTDWTATEVRFVGTARFPGAVDLARELVEELETKPAGCELMVECGTTRFLVMLIRECMQLEFRSVQKLAPQLPSWQMVKSIEHMNARGKAQLRIPELCKEIGSSPSRFIRLFANSTGVTPAGYYNRLLMEKANAMLAVGYTTKEAAFALGFTNDSHFCAFFRKWSGLTPGDFKNGCGTSSTVGSAHVKALIA